MCVFVVCMCARALTSSRSVDVISSRAFRHLSRKETGKRGRESVNRSRNDATGNAKYEKDTPQTEIRTRAEVKDDTVSGSFPTGDEREKKRTEGGQKWRWNGREGEETGRN